MHNAAKCKFSVNTAGRHFLFILSKTQAINLFNVLNQLYYDEKNAKTLAIFFAFWYNGC